MLEQCAARVSCIGVPTLLASKFRATLGLHFQQAIALTQFARCRLDTLRFSDFAVAIRHLLQFFSGEWRTNLTFLSFPSAPSPPPARAGGRPACGAYRGGGAGRAVGPHAFHRIAGGREPSGPA